jgi:hypothetical protein
MRRDSESVVRWISQVLTEGAGHSLVSSPQLASAMALLRVGLYHGAIGHCRISDIAPWRVCRTVGGTEAR